MRKSQHFFTALLFVFFSLLVSTRAGAQNGETPAGKSKAIHTYTLVISGLNSAEDASSLNADLLKIGGVLSSKTTYETGTIVVTAKKGVMPEHLKKIIVAHSCDISAFTETYE